MSITFARYLDVLSLLQAGRRVSATEISQKLGVSTRAVRRHIDELRLLGYDISSLRGPQGGYVLEGGMNILPLNFTDDEALALSYGLLLLKDSAALGKVSASALARLLPSLPKHVADKLQALRDSVTMSAPRQIVPVPSDVLMQVSRATRERERLLLRYQAADSSITSREFDPYAVAHVFGLWFVVGYCHLRQALRTFRIDRIIKLTFTDTSFTVRAEPDFDVIEFVVAGIAHSQYGRRKVVIDFEMSLEQAQQLFPAGYVILQATETGVRMTAYVKEFRVILGALVNYLGGFQIIEPSGLKDELQQCLREVLGRLEQT